MKKLLCCLILLSVLSASAQKPITLTYFQNDTLKLDLDLFLPQKPSKAKLPLLLYVHGGGFSGGERQSGYPICQYLSQNGFAAATITYTLYAKGKKFGCDGVTSEKVKAFQYAANDLWLATAFFLAQAQTYNLDPSRIFIAGSSAGAETVLHAAYWDRQTMALYPQKLPETFRYAGLISGAGAIMDLNLIAKANVLPMFFFHGSCDMTVPYGTAAHHFCKANASGWLMLFGSYTLFNHAKSLDGSVALHTFCGGGHEYSGSLFEKNQQELLAFLNNVLDGKRFQTQLSEPTGKKNAVSETFGFCD